MAAPYKVVVSKITCYNNVVLDNRLQNVIHYCPGACQAHRFGVQCLVAHHTVCSELLKAPETALSHGGDVTNTITVGESVVCGEDYTHLNPRVKKASTVPSTSSLKDITGEAINLASGKAKEFSFEKLKNAPSQHVNFRKGRKVRPESFGRRSADYDFIFGQFGNNENCPPLGLLQVSEEKTLLPHGTSLEQSINNMASLYLQELSEENLINQILKKHKLDGSGSGEDIKMCLDILLKCSEDLKKCTNIIKQCIKNRSVGGNSSGMGEGKGADHFPNPEIIYMNVMARLSSYLKKLPFELEQGRTEPSDLAELVKSLNSLQQHPFSPIYGHEQPPKYEDVVQSPPSLKAITSSPSEKQESMLQIANDSTVKTTPEVAPPLPAKTWQRGNRQIQASSLKNYSSQQTMPPAQQPRSSAEKLFIEEDSDSHIALSYQKRSPSAPNIPALSESRRWSSESQLAQKSANPQHPIEMTLKCPSNSSHSPSSNGSTKAVIPQCKGNTGIPPKVFRSNDHEEIDKLLLDLERFSQKIENTLKNPPLSSTAPSRVQHGLSVPDEHNFQLASSAQAKGATTNESEDDDNLLSRILGSIEDFAQELVDWRSGRGTLSKQKEVMQILQETIVPQSPLPSPSSQNQLKDFGPTLSIQQTPEVVKVSVILCNLPISCDELLCVL